MDGRIIGIDLGTSTTEASYIEDGKPRIILTAEGSGVIPSVVGIGDDGNWVVGERARNQLLVSPKKTAAEFKRKIGHDEPVTLGNEEFSAAEISGKLLSYIKSYASEALGEDIRRAVISVPAYFDEIQRQETVLAGQLAGFTVERIINEPTAAALSYGLEHMEEEEHILVYDLGGGTFDVTVLEMFDGVLEVKASNGDNELGGKDFDEKLIKWMAERFNEEHGQDPLKDVFAASRLKDEAEKCKKALSEKESFTVMLPALMEKDGKPLSLEAELTRDMFNGMTAELIKRTHRPIQTALSDAKIKASDLSRIILVGGSTRMPMVREDIREFLGREPEEAVDPELAVSQGAAIQAGIINDEILPENSIVMTDVNPYSLGVRTFNGFSNDCMSVIIRRNSTIPSVKKDTFATSADYQESVKVDVYQGESDIASHNHFLGTFTVNGVPPRKAGKEKVSIEFSYDLNGMLKVTAMLLSTGKEASIDIDMLRSKKKKDKAVNWEKSPIARRFKRSIRETEKLLKSDELEALPFEKETIDEMLHELKEAVAEGDEERALELDEELFDLMNDLLEDEDEP